jgi:predicted transcriptional regulator/transcriptional regulator with XRE-family HTH domain
MRKVFAGVRLKRLREERRLTQAALAGALGLSTTYVSQLEHDQRPLTMAVLLKIKEVFGIAIPLDEDAEARLAGDLRDALAELGDSVAQAEIRQLASAMPDLGRAVLNLHRRYRQTLERSEALTAGLDQRDQSMTALAPHEEVRNYFYDHRNHIPELDAAAEHLFLKHGLTIGDMERGLEALLAEAHGVTVQRVNSGDHRRFDRGGRVLTLPTNRSPGQQAFQMATQLAFLSVAELLNDLTRRGRFSDVAARDLARIGLANYFAGALVLPYTPFLDAAEEMHYDIDLLQARFGVGFETVCHRLSTLQRPNAQGVPFFFVRVDRAGNISKRQSATDFHFSRVGGTCPLWNVYEAFAMPGRILTQVARMPDSRTYLWLARTVSHHSGGWGAPDKTFAIGLGCDIRHAHRLVYSRGMDLRDPSAATPIGGGCRVCERAACPQRAFPAVGRALAVSENHSQFEPYASATIDSGIADQYRP